MPQESNDKNWAVLPNFDGRSRYAFSSASGQVKRAQDPGIIRPVGHGGFIDHEGFFDLTFYDCEQLARLIGWVPVEEATDALDRIADLERQLAEARLATLVEAANAIAALSSPAQVPA